MWFLKPEFWRSYWIALRRSRKDARARRAAVAITLFFGYFIVVLAYVAISVMQHSGSDRFWMAFFCAIMLGGPMIVAGMLTRARNQQDELLSIKFTERKRPGETLSPAVGSYLEEPRRYPERAHHSRGQSALRRLPG